MEKVSCDAVERIGKPNCSLGGMVWIALGIGIILTKKVKGEKKNKMISIFAWTRYPHPTVRFLL